MERAIEIFAAVNFLIIGLSHIFQHRAWTEFFMYLHQRGRVGAFANGFLSLFMGTLIVSFHNVWTGLPAVLTVLGWGMVLKAVITFVNPAWGLRSMARVREDNSRQFIVAGVLFVVVAAVLGYSISQSA